LEAEPDAVQVDRLRIVPVRKSGCKKWRQI
jgi:hypothetical protein